MRSYALPLPPSALFPRTLGGVSCSSTLVSKSARNAATDLTQRREAAKTQKKKGKKEERSD
jgi:hypothetical protein